MRKIDINKYWIGYLAGTLICINLISVGVIFTHIYSLNWIYFFWIYLISVSILIPIFIMRNEQKKRERLKNE